MTEILPRLDWPLTIPFAVVIIVIIFKKQLTALLSRLQSIKGEGAKYEILFGQRNPESLPHAGQKVIEPADVIEAFDVIPDFTGEETNAQIQLVHASLLRNGIVTKDALHSLARSRETLNVLRSLYVELLGRPKEKPLDPVAVATWGAGLFLYGVRPEVVQAVRNGIMSSSEFRQRPERL